MVSRQTPQRSLDRTPSNAGATSAVPRSGVIALAKVPVLLDDDHRRTRDQHEHVRADRHDDEKEGKRAEDACGVRDAAHRGGSVLGPLGESVLDDQAVGVRDNEVTGTDGV